jgi:pheromone shutdown protein TraB
MKAKETAIFQVGRHVLHVVGLDGQWVVTVDGMLVDGWFTAPSEAWTAGVTEADRQDRSRSETVGGATRLGLG